MKNKALATTTHIVYGGISAKSKVIVFLKA